MTCREELRAIIQAANTAAAECRHNAPHFEKVITDLVMTLADRIDRLEPKFTEDGKLICTYPADRN